MKKIFNRRNRYFATFHVYDEEADKFIGILEHHDTDVKQEYYIGWRPAIGEFFPNLENQKGITEMFYAEDEAIEYIARTVRQKEAR